MDLALTCVCADSCFPLSVYLSRSPFWSKASAPLPQAYLSWLLELLWGQDSGQVAPAWDPCRSAAVAWWWPTDFEPHSFAARPCILTPQCLTGRMSNPGFGRMNIHLPSRPLHHFMAGWLSIYHTFLSIYQTCLMLTTFPGCHDPPILCMPYHALSFRSSCLWCSPLNPLRQALCEWFGLVERSPRLLSLTCIQNESAHMFAFSLLVINLGAEEPATSRFYTWCWHAILEMPHPVLQSFSQAFVRARGFWGACQYWQILFPSCAGWSCCAGS